MQLAPRYDGPPIITFDLPAAVRAPFLRQRDRLAAALAGLSGEQWAAPSRCEAWSALDVAIHLQGTNGFWHVSIASGLAGEPTRYLGGGFDPRATPAAMVDAGRSVALEEAVEQLRASDRALYDLVAGLDEAAWQTTAEAPPGHLPVELVVHHALWDAWVHERDILLPLGLTPAEEDDEVLACLRYAAALGPALGLGIGGDGFGSGSGGDFVLEVNDPDARLVVEVGDVVRVHDGDAPDGATVVRGQAVDVLEVLSVRTPPGGDVSESAAWLAGALATIFENERSSRPATFEI